MNKRKNFAKSAWKNSSSLKEYFEKLRNYDKKVEMEEKGK